MNALHELPDDLINGFLRQSYAGAVRQRLLAIERAVQSGQRHELIVRGLEQGGMKASMATFRKSLSRARIWWRRQLLMQMAQHQAQQQVREDGAVLGIASPTQTIPGPAVMAKGESASISGVGNQAAHSRVNARQSAVAASRPELLAEVNLEIQRSKPVPRPKSLSGVDRVDLDRFFKTKSVFTKT